MKMAENKNFNIAVEGDVESFAHIPLLYFTQNYADCILVAEDQEHPVHRIILCGKSSYFKSEMEGTKEIKFSVQRIPSHYLEKFLKYMYSGIFTCHVSTLKLLLSIMPMAYNLALFELVKMMAGRLYPFISFEVVVDILNTAMALNLDELAERCCKFLDSNAQYVSSKVDYKKLSQKAMICILERDTFFLDEIKIFEIALNWEESNISKDPFNQVLGCIRFLTMSETDVKEIVAPKFNLPLEQCRKYIERLMIPNKRIKGVYTTLRTSQALNVGKVNLASKAYDAKYINGPYSGQFVNEIHNNGVVGKCDGIVIELGAIYVINYIEFYLHYWDKAKKAPGALGYFIEVSVNNFTWVRIVDYRGYSCAKKQELCVSCVNVKYIRIVATGANAFLNKIFQIDNLRVYSNQIKEKIMTFVEGIAKFFKPRLLSTSFVTIRSSNFFNGVLSMSPGISSPAKILLELNQPTWLKKLSFSIDTLLKFTITVSVGRPNHPKIYIDLIVNRKDGSAYNIEFAEQIVTYIEIEVESESADIPSLKSIYLS